MFRRLTLIAAAVLLPLLGWAQTYTPNAGQLPFYGPLRSDYIAPAGSKMLDARDLDGLYVKSIILNGAILTATYQDADNAEHLLNVTVGGGGGFDGVLTTAAYESTTEVLTLTTSTGGVVTASFAEVTTAADLTAALEALATVPSGGVPGDVLTWQSDDTWDWAAPVGDGVVEDGSVSGTTLTLDRTGSLSDVVITGLPQDGVVEDGSVSGTTLTLDRTVGADVVITGLPSGGAADGVVEDGSVSGTTLTLIRTIGGDVTITGLPQGAADGVVTTVIVPQRPFFIGRPGCVRSKA